MYKLLKLVKLSWALKVSMWKCNWYGKSTDEYSLAKHYKSALDKLENTSKEVEALLLETQALQKKFQNKKEIKNLLTAVIAFLRYLEVVRN